MNQTVDAKVLAHRESNKRYYQKNKEKLTYELRKEKLKPYMREYMKQYRLKKKQDEMYKRMENGTNSFEDYCLMTVYIND